MKRKKLFSQNSNSSSSGFSNGESVTQPMAVDQIQTQTESSAPTSPTAKRTKPNHKEFSESPILNVDLKRSESIASNNVYESRYRKLFTDFCTAFFEGLRYEACIIKKVEILNKKMIDEKQKYELNRDKLKTLSDLNERVEFEFIKAKSEETAAMEKLEAKRNERGYGPDSLNLESPIEFGESSSPVPDNSALRCPEILNKLTREQYLTHHALNQSQAIQNKAFLLKTYEDLLKKSSAMEQDNVSLFKEIKDIETSINHFEKGRMKSESKKRAIEEEMTSLNNELKKLAEETLD